MKKLAVICGLLACTISSTPSFAQESQASDNAYLSFAVGSYGIFDNDNSTDFRAEYTGANALFWKLKPWGGVEATSEGTLWGGGGVKADFMPASNIYITPSAGVGLYSQGDDDIDLGSSLEFRLQAEGGYEFTNGHRVGLALGHLSNAGIGDTNPGVETLNVYYHIPVGSMF